MVTWWSSGRFFPINVLLYEAVFRHVDHDNTLVYHAIQILLIGLCFILFVAHVRRTTTEKSAPLLATLLLLSVSAVRPDYHDPYVSYHLQQPVFFLLFFSSFVALELLLRLRRTRLIASSLAVLAALTFAHSVHSVGQANAHFNAARLTFDTMRDDLFLRQQGARRVYVSRAYTYHPAAYLKVNRRVPLIHKDPGQLAEGDRVLLIHPDVRGRQWGYWGRWSRDGTVSDLHRVRPAAGQVDSRDRGHRVGAWHFEPMNQARRFDELRREVR